MHSQNHHLHPLHYSTRRISAGPAASWQLKQSKNQNKTKHKSSTNKTQTIKQIKHKTQNKSKNQAKQKVHSHWRHTAGEH
jgi:hypothetical protein